MNLTAPACHGPQVTHTLEGLGHSVVSPSYFCEIRSRGFAIQRGVVSAETLSANAQAIEQARDSSSGRHRRGELFGIRNLLSSVPQVRELVTSGPIAELVEPVLGPAAIAVRGLYFDKTPAANWRLGWHQDKAIAVKQRAEVPGYVGWSVKAGIQHVFPPAEVLAGILTVRLHLDACDASSGALLVIPGSHKMQDLAESDLANLASTEPIEACEVEAGDAVVMSPLIAHSSEKSANPSHRRVIHIEFASRPLPAPLEWNECVPVSCAF